jgi:putative ABC transport system substrate-binding protein
MNRREFVTGLGSATTFTLAARAQPSPAPIIAYLTSASADRSAELAFRLGLSETGYEEGRNVAIESRSSGGHDGQLPALAAELLSRGVNVMFAAGVNAALAAKSATSTVPIVFSIGGDPVDVGLVSSINRPLGNITGVSTLNATVAPKRLQLLHELLPNAHVLAALLNPARPTIEAETEELQIAARNLGVELFILHASADLEFDTAFSAMSRLDSRALLIGPGAFFTSRATQLAELTVRYAVPAIFQYRNFIDAGGLMSYGGDFNDTNRRAGAYVGRILRGEKTTELPVQQATRVELFLNLKTARALGLIVPPSILLRADAVIE